LLAEGETTDAQIADLTAEFDAIVEAAAADAPDDEHDPDGSTVGFERARVAALLELAQRRRAQLDQAISRIGSEAYGRCERCGQTIAPERLTAQPATTTCIACASAAPPPLSNWRHK
jgi:DnaK suppressor protein